MAKKSQVLRDERRKKLIAKYAEKRAALRKTLQSPDASIEEKIEAQEQFAKLPRNSCPTRLNRRCQVSGRSKGYYRKFAISRIALRELALRGSAARACASRAGRGAIREGRHPPRLPQGAVRRHGDRRRVGQSLDDDVVKETKEVDGEELPVIKLEISSQSHPFWTGTMRELDADGKIDRFRRRYGKGKK